MNAVQYIQKSDFKVGDVIVHMFSVNDGTIELLHEKKECFHVFSRDFGLTTLEKKNISNYRLASIEEAHAEKRL